MSNSEVKYIQKIQAAYSERKVSKLDELKNLNKKVERPAEIFAYTFGTAGALVLGTGMSLAMKIIGTSLSFAMPLGVAVGVVGLAAVSLNYFIHKKILASRKKKYAKEVLSLTDELLNK